MVDIDELLDDAHLQKLKSITLQQIVDCNMIPEVKKLLARINTHLNLIDNYSLSKKDSTSLFESIAISANKREKQG